MRAAENDFEGTRTTIPQTRDATEQGGDGGAFVRVHAGRGQATFCAGAYRTWSGSLHQRAGAAHASVRKRNQSHPLARDDGTVNNDGHKRRNETGFITVEKTLKDPLYQRV